MTNKLFVKVFTVAHVPPALEKAWLQHLRDFDVAHPGCHFEVLAEAPEQPMAEVIEMLRLDPALSFEQVLLRGKER
jgi:hypothetical protein